MPEQLESELNAEPSVRSMGLGRKAEAVKKLLSDKLQYAGEEESTNEALDANGASATDEGGGISKRLEAISKFAAVVEDPPRTMPKFRFITERNFTGMIVATEGEHLEAKLEDPNGQVFEYDFKIDELPPAQRSRAQVGAVLNVCSGSYLIGKTNKRGVKLYLTPDQIPEEIRENIVKEIVKKWEFL